MVLLHVVLNHATFASPHCLVARGLCGVICLFEMILVTLSGTPL